MDPSHHVFRKADGGVFFTTDREIDLHKLITAPLPKVPADVSFGGHNSTLLRWYGMHYDHFCVAVHWLAVEGVQPAIPQNPPTGVIAEVSFTQTLKL